MIRYLEILLPVVIVALATAAGVWYLINLKIQKAKIEILKKQEIENQKSENLESYLEKLESCKSIEEIENLERTTHYDGRL